MSEEYMSHDDAVAYWKRKLQKEGRPEKLCDKMVEFDRLVGRWYQMEKEMNLVGLLGKDGGYQGVRKVLSYDGTPDGKDGTDPGNWYYAVCIRHMLKLFPSRDWRVQGTEQLNDETAGDIMEAIWGLLWHRQTQGPLEDAIPVSVIATMELRIYCRAMTCVVHLLVELIDIRQYFVGSEWPSSQELATCLI